MTREELIAALEKATGPSWELDEAIMCCVYADLKPERHLEGWYSASGDHIRVDRYTASIDAALTLVPEGWRWSLDWTQRPPYQDCGRADLYAPGAGIKPPDVSDVYGATPAIALCIAALKARAP